MDRGTRCRGEKGEEAEAKEKRVRFQDCDFSFTARDNPDLV